MVIADSNRLATKKLRNAGYLRVRKADKGVLVSGRFVTSTHDITIYEDFTYVSTRRSK